MAEPAAATPDASAPPDGVSASLGLKDVTSKMADNQREKVAAEDKIIGKLDSTIAQSIPKIEQLSKNAGVEAAQLKPWNADEEAAKRRTDPIEAFGSFGSVFGILASAFTHAPMENALNASAAAMNAIKENDSKSYDRAQKAWEDNLKMTMDRHAIQHEAYQDATALLSTNMQAAQTKLAVLAARFGDKQVQTLLDAGMNKEVEELLQGRQRNALALQEAMPGIIENNARISRLFALGYDTKNPQSEKSQQAFQQYQKEIAAQKAAERGGFPTLAREQAVAVKQRAERLKADAEAKGEPITDDQAFTKAMHETKLESSVSNAELSNDAVQMMAEQYLHGDKSVMQNLGRGAQGSANVVRVREEIAKQMKAQGITGADAAIRMAEFSGAMAAERSLGTRTANVEMFSNEALNMIDVAQEQSHKIKRTDFVPANKALQAWERGTGDPEIRAFGAAINSLVNTYAKAIAGGQQATVSDKDHAREIVTSADTQEQFDAVMNVIKKELQAARKAPGQVKQELRDLGGSSSTLNSGSVPSAPGGIIEYDQQGNRVK